MSGLVLFGIGARVCVDVVESCRRNGETIEAAIRNVPGDVYVGAGIRIVEVADVTADIAASPFLLPMFAPQNRRTALAAARQAGFRNPGRLIDRTAIVASDCAFEGGVYVNAGCILGSSTSLDEFVFCNRGANLGHHCRIGAFVSIGPGALLAGSVTVGADSQIGAGAIILPQVTIGSNVLVAPGAVVSRDVPDGSFVAGNPARILARPA